MRARMDRALCATAWQRAPGPVKLGVVSPDVSRAVAMLAPGRGEGFLGMVRMDLAMHLCRAEKNWDTMALSFWWAAPVSGAKPTAGSRQWPRSVDCAASSSRASAWVLIRPSSALTVGEHASFWASVVAA